MSTKWRATAAVMVAFLIAALDGNHAGGQDWPMWRYDAGRTAASPHPLPDDLQLIWTRQLTPRKQAWDDPLNLDLMTYDRVFEPIVVEGRLFVGFNDVDKLAALDAETGAELWSFYAEAPVRLPPVGWKGNVYFCSDDGFLYCVDAVTGKLVWKFRAAPSAQHAIGNQRLTSAWPARGGPVIRDGVVYFAASIWPFMGTFIYALDATTGKPVWVNDTTGAQYIKQPHSAPSFAGVAPQGALVATEALLLVPGGRSVPAAFDRATGKLRYFEINAGGKGTGGSFVSANEKHFFVHTRHKGTRAFHLHNGVKTAFMPSEPVLDGKLIYSAEQRNDKPVVRAYDENQDVIWELPVDGSGDLILAGDKLVAAGENTITTIQLGGKSPRVSQTLPLADVSIQRLLAADQKLFAVALDGRLMAFGDAKRPMVRQARAAITPIAAPAASIRTAQQLLSAGDADGYAFWYGSWRSSTLKALVTNSPFTQLAVVSGDELDVADMRRDLDAAGLYGAVTAHHSEVHDFLPPQYVANMLFVDIDRSGFTFDLSQIANLYRSVRPYGGVMQLLTEEKKAALAGSIQAANWEQAKVEINDHGVKVTRTGALPGSADWTHQYGDIANTLKSDDSRVKLPLGILWFGGSSNMDVLPRHGHGPPEQVIGGRLFIQGMNCLSARDVYTGRVLWKREFDDLGTFDVFYDGTYENTPLDPKYNQVHIPGANARGTNYVVTEDRVYLIEGDVCHAIDPATGETLKEFRMPRDDDGRQPGWGYIGVYKDVLIGGAGFANYRSRDGLSFPEDKGMRKSKAGFGAKSLDRAASAALIGFDRHSGKQLWQVAANHSFWHNGVVAGGDQVFCLDRNPKKIEDALRRRGKSRPEGYRILAIDYRTGTTNWEVTDGIFGTWLGYSRRHDLLLQAGAKASDRLYDEVDQGMTAYDASTGKIRWQKENLRYSGPCILYNDLVITNANSYSDSAGAFYLANGKPKLVENPLTGQLQPWKVTRAYGCNNIIASENLLTFRSGAAGFYDLKSQAGTGNLGGFKSGCTSNLVVANGVLNAPDYTRTCSCAYQNQTSLGLVHMPEVEMWTVNAAASVQSQGKRIKRLGVNFGAPGDRRDKNGLLWIEHPVVAGTSPPVTIKLNDDARFFQRHSSAVSDSSAPWILASGVSNVTDVWIDMKLAGKFDISNGIPVAHVDDDAEENEKGEVNRTSSDLELIEDGDDQIVGMRFNEINLPQGAKVRGAYVQFTCDETSDKSTSLIIAAEDSGDAERFSGDRHDLSSRSRTSAEVSWEPPPWKKKYEAGERQRTPDLGSLIEEVVNRNDWKPGNSIALLITGTGKRVAVSSKSGSNRAPKLVIDADALSTERNKQTERYDVQLLFSASPDQPTNRTVFDIYGGEELLADSVTLSRGENSYVTQRLDNIAIGDRLHLRLVSKQGVPSLSGISIVRREQP